MPTTTVAHLVLTGGPCAGKTTALDYLRTNLAHHGWAVLVVPEAATLLMAGGVNLPALAQNDRAAFLDAQVELISTQRMLADRFTALAATLPASRVALIHDRGIADNAAYMSPGEYEDVLGRCGLDATGAHHLYDAVLHLRSAATVSGDYDGSAYTTANNEARTETAAAAAALDEATLLAWRSHPHLSVISAGGNFETKLERTLTAALGALGDPEPVEIEAKYLLATAPDLTHPVLAGAARIDIEQVYLPVGEAGEQRVRARTVDGVTQWWHTTKQDRADGSRVEVEKPIGQDMYAMFAQLRDPATAVIRKTRHVFVDGDQRFELDEIHEPVRAWLLEAELVSAGDVVRVPEFLPDALDVTTDPAWRNRAIATRTRT